MKIEKITNDEVKNYLFFEANNTILSNVYRKGIAWQLLSIFKKFTSTLFAKTGSVELNNNDIAVTFFLNEENAASKYRKLLNYDINIHINFKNYSFVVAQIGYLKMIVHIGYFFLLNLHNRNWSHFGAISSPLSGYLLYVSWLCLLRRTRPNKIFLFNCVHPSSLAILLACQKNKIDVEYCEHAVTTKLMLENCKKFSKIHVYYPFTKKIMINSGLSEASIYTFFQGSTCKLTECEKISNIGLCLNDLDEIGNYEKLVQALRETRLKVSVRVHDAHPDFKYIEKTFNKLECFVERANEYPIEGFLRNNDVIIAGNSNVLSDAIIDKKPCYYLWTGDDEIYDYYGLVNAYGIPAFTNVEHLVKHINERIS